MGTCSRRRKRHYLDLIRKYKDRHGFKLYAWVIISNHVHMLIEVGEEPSRQDNARDSAELQLVV